ncbi:MAG: hypothetical protein DRP12_00625, partial [Candidatus Aenigmatarchaeota archaeon]
YKDYWEKNFKNLPLAVSIGEIIAVHGAIPPVDNLKEIDKIEVPDKEYKISSLDLKNPVLKFHITVWGDWTEKDVEFYYKEGRVEFGKNYFERVMERIGKKILIRGHQPEKVGENFFEGSRYKCLTIFTSKYYSNVPRCIAVADFFKGVLKIIDIDNPDKVYWESTIQRITGLGMKKEEKKKAEEKGPSPEEQEKKQIGGAKEGHEIEEYISSKPKAKQVSEEVKKLVEAYQRMGKELREQKPSPIFEDIRKKWQKFAEQSMGETKKKATSQEPKIKFHLGIALATFIIGCLFSFILGSWPLFLASLFGAICVLIPIPEEKKYTLIFPGGMEIKVEENKSDDYKLKLKLFKNASKLIAYIFLIWGIVVINIPFAPIIGLILAFMLYFTFEKE